ncbi:multiubiquitin domain-containing protein [Flavihumibacter profundi]|uniref:multiubiquitin domain-containing protein n=1 Tax=Flavihumibacter profundi TaxID=2716883 RepID=UPI001CC55C20|nr:multiubiquitin domain-containing protein [Flavihumibacter profundi]MBZ5859088.1 multiubiquitin domain-containing protein [Flavihumibacter profundi]
MSEAIEKKDNEKYDDKKDVTIYVNAETKDWKEKSISFEQVVVLAFGVQPENASQTYTVTYKKGNDKKPEGSLTKGQSVHVKDLMRFNVTPANQS